MQGMLTSVDEVFIGSDLDADVAAGATSVSPTDIDSFHAEGGTAIIGDLEGVNEEITYEALTTDEDGVLVGPLTLTAPLDNAYTEDSGARIVLTEEGNVLTERRAYIQPELQDREQAVLVPTTMWDRVPLGTRDPDSGERAFADYTDGGDLMLTHLIARTPQQSGEFLDPITTPHPHDGEPPSASPTPEVIGGVGTLFVTWEAIENNDSVFYDVHISDDPGFTIDYLTTFAGQEVGTMVMLRGLPDGTPFELDTDYYVKLIARDVDGPAPESAEASGQIEAVTPGITATDGSVPASSPTPTVVGGPTYLAAKWTPITNPDPVRYEVHISATNGFTPSGATPGTGTFYGETSAGSMVINKLADGSALSYGTTYYVKIVAKDGDGKNAGPYTQGSGAMVKVDGGVDILARSIIAGDVALNTLTGNEILAGSVNADRITVGTLTADRIQTGTFSSQSIFSDKVVSGIIAADRLVANSITAGQIATTFIVSNLFATATSGKRVEFDTNGIRLYDPGGSLIVNLSSSTGSASFAGTITASTITGSTVQSSASNPAIRFNATGLRVTNSGGGDEILIDTNGMRMLEGPGASPGTINMLRWMNAVSGLERQHLAAWAATGTSHWLRARATDGTRSAELIMVADGNNPATYVQATAGPGSAIIIAGDGTSSFGQLATDNTWTGSTNTWSSSATRFAQITSLGTGQFRFDDNSMVGVLTLVNAGVTNVAHGVRIRFQRAVGSDWGFVAADGSGAGGKGFGLQEGGGNWRVMVDSNGVGLNGATPQAPGSRAYTLTAPTTGTRTLNGDGAETLNNTTRVLRQLITDLKAFGYPG